MALLSINNLSVTYKMKNKNIHAVNDISFEVEEEDSVGIIGESGSGKSTLAMSILRLLRGDTVEITGSANFDGTDLLNISENQLSKLRWTKMAAVFQKSMNSLSPVHKIGSQLMDIYRVHEKNISREDAKRRILELFEMVNLPPRVFTLYQHELSGGMMQRVSIAMSLMHNPKLLILDEATTALDVVTQSQILDEIVKLEQKLKITRLMITHDMSVVATSCKKVIVMYAGYMLEMGTVSEVMTNPAHPYTMGLIKSFPSFRGERGELKGIPGYLPDLSVKPKGCVFAKRCSKCFDKCLKEMPENRKIADDHIVACHLIGGEQQ